MRRKSIVLLVILALVLGMQATPLYASAATVTATYGNKTLPLNEYNPNKKAAAFTPDKEPCPKHKGSSKGCRSICIDGAKQCLGFAFYVQDELFGFHYKNKGEKNKEHFDIYKYFDCTKTKKADKIAYMKEFISKLRLGAHIRTSSGHSLIYMKSDANNVWMYDANSNYRCSVKIRTFTWKSMYDYFDERNGVAYVASPKEDLFCKHKTYSETGYCTSCGKAFPVEVKELKKYAVYKVTSLSALTYSRPYTEKTSAGTLLYNAQEMVVASAKNHLGQQWYLLENDKWVSANKVKKVKDLSSKLRITFTQAPSILGEGDSFSLRGTITSDYKITSVTGAIYPMNSDKAVDTTTDKPNAKSVDIRKANLNQKMEFGDLKIGTYRLVVTVKDASGNKITKTKSFVVAKKDAEQPQEPAPTPTPQPAPTPTPTPSDDKPAAEAVCKHPTYNTRGFCTSCGESYPYVVTKMSATALETAKANVRVLARPFIAVYPEYQIAAAGTKVTVVASTRDYAGTTWYQLTDGNWVSPSDLRKVTPAPTPTPAPSSQVIPDGVYVIATKLDQNFVLDIESGSLDDYGNLQLWENNGTPAQQFRVTHKGSGYYQLVGMESGKALSTQNGSTAGTNVCQLSVNGSDAQLWKIVSAGDGSYLLMRKGTNQYLDVDNAWADYNSNVKIFDRNDAYAAQNWIFKKIG